MGEGLDEKLWTLNWDGQGGQRTMEESTSSSSFIGIGVNLNEDNSAM